MPKLEILSRGANHFIGYDEKLVSLELPALKTIIAGTSTAGNSAPAFFGNDSSL